MMTILSLFCLTLLVLTAFQEQLVPSTFGTTTMTHIRGQNNQFFKDFIKRYAEMDCKVISQISIVWNNDFPIEDSISSQFKANWIKPVYFFQTQFNSLSFKYVLPKQSKQSVYFAMDDDINETCAKLQHDFKVWQQYAYGSLGPLVGAFCFGNAFDTVNIEFRQDSKHQYFTQVITAGAFVSKQIIDLYNSKLDEPYLMNKIVRRRNNCQDIATNCLVSKFYPHLKPIDLHQGLGSIDNPYSLSKNVGTNDFGISRGMCLQQFAEITGQTLQLMGAQKNMQQIHWRLPKQLQTKIILLASNLVKYQVQIKDKQARNFEKNLKKIEPFVQSIFGLYAQKQEYNSRITFANGLLLGLNSILTTFLIYWCTSIKKQSCCQ